MSVQSAIGGGCNSQADACGRAYKATGVQTCALPVYSYAGSAGQVLSFGLFGPIACSSEGMNADIYGPSGQLLATVASPCDRGAAVRSEERPVGKESRSRRAPHY